MRMPDVNLKMAAMLEEVLKYMKGFSGAWFPCHHGVARGALSHAVGSNG